jgi:hypothetical protein
LNQLLLSLARKELELYALFWATIFYIIFVLAYEYFSFLPCLACYPAIIKICYGFDKCAGPLQR